MVSHGSASAYGTAPATGTTVTLAPPSRSGAHPGDGLEAPSVYQWDGVDPSGGGADGGGSADGGRLRLWAGRKLYAPGVAVTHSAAVSALAAVPTIRLHPDELNRLGLSAGGTARAASPRGSVTLVVASDTSVPPGVAWVPAGEAADLVDIATAVTSVNVEPANG
jgi:formylmethanofuran dehydrogenase subunit D